MMIRRRAKAIGGGGEALPATLHLIKYIKNGKRERNGRGF